jgi:hypothetical protein
MSLFEDSTGKPIKIGDRVKFRTEFYTINEFIPGIGRFGSAVILFGEKCHTSEMPDELSVDKVNQNV